MFQTFIGITALSALLSLINKKWFKLPDTIGVMILAIVFSALLALYSFFDPHSVMTLCEVVKNLDFRTILFEFLLGFLLFAGAMHVNFNQLIKELSPVILYATLGVFFSTFIVGTLFYYAAQFIQLDISFAYALVFGALISPTDPIAVLALLTKAGTSKDIEIKIVGESLFNDGVGIIVFLTILSFATGMEAEFSLAHMSLEFLKEVGGGLALGGIIGYLGTKILSGLKEDSVIAIHITLAIVMGGYSLGSLLHISGALAMVISGLILGHFIHLKHSSQKLKTDISLFWKVIDEILNSILFVLIGLEVISLHFHLDYFILGIVAIIIVLVSRFTSLFLTNIFIQSNHRADLKTMGILTWAGLRGGISIALVLSLPDGEIRQALLMATYVVVLFSIIVQGLSMEKVVKFLKK